RAFWPCSWSRTWVSPQRCVQRVVLPSRLLLLCILQRHRCVLHRAVPDPTARLRPGLRIQLRSRDRGPVPVPGRVAGRGHEHRPRDRTVRRRVVRRARARRTAAPRNPRTGAGMTMIDTHCHVLLADGITPPAPVPGAAYGAPPVGLAEHRAHLDALGCDRGVLVQPSAYGTSDYGVLLATLRRDPDPFRAVACVTVVPPDA